MSVGNELHIEWEGPFAWTGYERQSGLSGLPKLRGVYLQAVEHGEGYAVYGAGITLRTVHIRFQEHLRKWLAGDYTVLDIEAMQRGERKEVWHGWGWTEAKKIEFEKRRPEIMDAAHKQLAGLRIFVADVGTERRVLERMEAAIMALLYRQPAPLCKLPDRGMMLAPRRANESSMTVYSRCAVTLHGIPDRFEM